MAEAARQHDKLGVFISYSRDDLEFADQLDIALRFAGFATTLDRHGISGGEDWQNRLGNLIRDADTIVFVLSPSSARSEVCRWEVEQAVRLGKRIIPVPCRPLDGVPPPPQLASLDYIFFYAEPHSPGSGFGSGLARLATALNTDLDWLREHTRLLQRATEWHAGGRPSNRLLSGGDILEAKAWAARRPKDAPEPTMLHLDYLQASEQYEADRKSQERRMIEERERLLAAAEQAAAERAAAQEREAAATRRIVQRTLVGGAAALVLALVAGAFGIYAFQQKREADVQRLEAEAQTKVAVVQRERAESESAKARQAVEVVDTLTSSGWDLGRGEQTSEERDRDLYTRMAHIATRGNSTAARVMGQLTSDGRGTDKDHSRSQGWLEQAATAGDAGAIRSLGDMYFRGLGVQQDYSRAKELFEKAAALGDIRANFLMGALYFHGAGVPQDYAKAQEWFEKGATGGDAQAMFNVGVLYFDGLGVSRDYEQALQWFVRSAEAGSTNAMFNLGTMYLGATGVEQDYAKAREWFEKAVVGGNMLAAYHIGALYFHGWSTAQDFAKAREWFEKAGKAGSSEAMFNLAFLHFEGLGGERNAVLARDWFEKAAAAGNTAALVFIGAQFEEGNGASQDHAKAREWYERADAKGYPAAKQLLRQLAIRMVSDSRQYAEALRMQEEAAGEAESEEVNKDGKPGPVTAAALQLVTRDALLAGDASRALAAAERSLGLDPESRQNAVGHAVALMFAGRMDEARNIFLAHKDKALSPSYPRLWQTEVSEYFKRLQKGGHTHHNMGEIEEALGISNASRH